MGKFDWLRRQRRPGKLLGNDWDLRVQGIALHGRQAVHLDDKATGESAQEAPRIRPMPVVQRRTFSSSA